MDVAEILTGEVAPAGPTGPPAASEFARQIQGYLDRAAPLFPRLTNDAEHRLLLLPASEAGKALGELVQQSQVKLKTIRVPGQAELLFCREIGWLNMQDIQPLLKTCRSAYEALTVNPQSSPHA